MDAPPTGRRPRTPTALRASRDADGRTRLRWKGATAGGTVFVVQRRTTGAEGIAGAWLDLVSTTQPRLIDERPPPGVALVEYRVRAERAVGISTHSEAADMRPPEVRPGSVAAAIGRIAPCERQQDAA